MRLGGVEILLDSKEKHNIYDLREVYRGIFDMFDEQSLRWFLAGASTLETHNPTHRSGAPQSDSDTGCLYLHRSDPPSYIYIYHLLTKNHKMRLEDKDV